jgi:hypothetical protein
MYGVRRRDAGSSLSMGKTSIEIALLVALDELL